MGHKSSLKEGEKSNVAEVEYIDTQREPTDEEKDILAWFEKQEAESIANLEAGARQIISLVTAFYGVLFGVLSLGSDSFAAALGQPWIAWSAIFAVFLLLAALLSALAVVIPFAYSYGEKRLDQQQAAYRQMLDHKSTWLHRAMLFFGLGVFFFAVLIGLLLWGRLL